MVFVSFDDHYLSWHEHLALFAKHGVTVAFYCNSLPLDRASDDPVVADYYPRLGRSRRTAVRCAACTCERWPRRGMISVVTAIHTSTSRHWKHQSWRRNSG